MNVKGFRTKQTANSGGAPGRDRAAELGQHLSEDQIDAELIGDLRPPGSTHLAGCHLCGSRVAKAAAPIADFKAVTLAWGERRSATLPLHQTVATSAKFHPRLAWAAAVTVALAMGVAIPVVSHQDRQQTAQTSAYSRSPIADSDTSVGNQIVRDNQMLQTIDRELDASVETPQALGLQPVSSNAERKTARPASFDD